MSKTLYLLLTHYGDYDRDYERFFSDNRALLAEAGIACPWLDDGTGGPWQSRLLCKLKAVNRGRGSIADELADILEKRDGMLLAAPVAGMWLIVQDLLALLRADERFSAWADAAVRVVWLARDRARECEGGFVYNLPADSTDSSYRFAMTGRESWLEHLAALLEMAEARAVLEDNAAVHVSMAEVLEKFGIALPAAECVPLRETPPLSREILWVRARLRAILPCDRDVSSLLAAVLPCEDNCGFLAPERLRTLHAVYAPGMRAIARKYGCEPTLAPPDAPEGVGEWKPFTPPEPAVCRRVYEACLDSLPPEDREYSLRLLENAWAIDWLTPDAPACAAELRVRYGIPQPESPLLSVLTLTRNHETYIGACIDSVLTQEITFPMRHIIVDDHSTDSTRRIVEAFARKHPSIWPVFLEAGRAEGDNVRALYSRCSSTYAALCEGDDYFTDPEKLQLQVDFLNANPDCSLCFHPVLVLFEKQAENNFIFPSPGGLPRGVSKRYYLADLAKANFIQTNSVVYRWRFGQGLPEWFRADVCPGDWYCHLLHAEVGRIGFIPRIMSVYRRHPSALYVDAFVRPAEHWRQHGMNELKAFHIFNEHFKGRYFRTLSDLANQVLMSFLEDKLSERDVDLFDKACEAYPEFVQNFLKNISITHVHRNKTDSPPPESGAAQPDEGGAAERADAGATA